MASNDLSRLIVKLEMQTAQYDATLKRVNSDLRRFRNDTNKHLGAMQKQFADFGRTLLRSLGIGTVTAALYGLISTIKSAVKAGDDLAKFAAKSGLAAEAASELAHAAKMADIDLAGLATGIKKMQVEISTARSKLQQTTPAFAALGLAFKDLKDLKPDEQFELIAEQISKLKDPADRTRAAVEIFGKSGADLLPLFEQGAAGIRMAREEAIRLGKSFSAEDLAKFAEADDAFKRLAASFGAFGDAITLKIAQPLTNLVDSLTKLINLDFNSSEVFKFFGVMLTTAPPMWIPRFVQMMAQAKADAGAVASSGPTGRVLPGLQTGAPPGFTPEAKKMTEDMIRFANQATQIANDAAGAFNSIAPSVEENTQAITAYFAAVNESNINASQRVIAMGEAYEETTKKLSVYAEEAARNMQDAFADFLFDPFENGLKGMLKSFIDTLRRMVANAMASKIFEMLGGLSGKGGFIGAIGDFFASAGGSTSYGGARASGGPVSAGSAYLVGEGGPEMFVPGASGTIVPNGGMMGLTYAPVINAQGADKDLRAALPGILAEDKRRFLETLRDDRSRR